MITLEKMVYISFDFSFFPLNFPPFLGIDHLENVSMRYQYPKVLGYRVLGIDIIELTEMDDAELNRLAPASIAYAVDKSQPRTIKDKEQH